MLCGKGLPSGLSLDCSNWRLGFHLLAIRTNVDSPAPSVFSGHQTGKHHQPGTFQAGPFAGFRGFHHSGRSGRTPDRSCRDLGPSADTDGQNDQTTGRQGQKHGSAADTGEHDMAAFYDDASSPRKAPSHLRA